MSPAEPTQIDPTNAPEAIFEFPEPVTHGAGITFHYDDLGLYEQAPKLWRSDVGDPAEQPVTVAEYQSNFIDRSGDFDSDSSSRNGKRGRKQARMSGVDGSSIT